MDLYILFSLIGFASAATIYVHLVKSKGYSLNFPLFAAIVSLIGLFVGARLFGLIASHIYFINTGKYIPSGFVFYGGLFGYIAVFLYLQKDLFHENSALLCDAAGVMIPLFHGFARIGCFYAGCCSGFVLNVPVQITESIFNFYLFGVLLFIYKKGNNRANLLSLYLFCYAIGRFILEFFRSDAERGMIGVLSFGQVCSIAVISVLIINTILNKKNDCTH